MRAETSSPRHPLLSINILLSLTDKFVVSQRLVIFSQKFLVVSGIPRLLAEGWLNLFELEASREAESELFSHRNNRKTFDVKKMTRSKKQ